jgi:hypothetical protein
MCGSARKYKPTQIINTSLCSLHYQTKRKLALHLNPAKVMLKDKYHRGSNTKQRHRRIQIIMENGDKKLPCLIQ